MLVFACFHQGCTLLLNITVVFLILFLLIHHQLPSELSVLFGCLAFIWLHCVPHPQGASKQEGMMDSVWQRGLVHVLPPLIGWLRRRDPRRLWHQRQTEPISVSSSLCPLDRFRQTAHHKTWRRCGDGCCALHRHWWRLPLSDGKD